MNRLAPLLALLLTGCGQQATRGEAAGATLERAAIATGTIRDPATGEIAGLYARDTDRLCLVGARGDGYRIGASIDYGAGQGCSGRGAATLSGETLAVTLDGTTAAADGDTPECSFEARIDQDRIVFPGSVPDACSRLCTERASLAALEVDLLSDATAEAAALRDRRGRPLCGR